MNTIILFATGILLGSLGSIAMRIGGKQFSHSVLSIEWLKQILQNPYIILGFILYLIPAFIWVYLLTKYPVSFVQPILALTYVVSAILALLLLKEPVSYIRWTGIIIIIFGVFIISKS